MLAAGGDGQHIVGDGDAAPQQSAPLGGRAVFLLQPAGGEVDCIDIIVSKAEQLGLQFDGIGRVVSLVERKQGADAFFRQFQGVFE